MKTKTRILILGAMGLTGLIVLLMAPEILRGKAIVWLPSLLLGAILFAPLTLRKPSIEELSKMGLTFALCLAVAMLLALITAQGLVQINLRMMVLTEGVVWMTAFGILLVIFIYHIWPPSRAS